MTNLLIPVTYLTDMFGSKNLSQTTTISEYIMMAVWAIIILIIVVFLIYLIYHFWM